MVAESRLNGKVGMRREKASNVGSYSFNTSLLLQRMWFKLDGVQSREVRFQVRRGLVQNRWCMDSAAVKP
jgi:hypothetical protein